LPEATPHGQFLDKGKAPTARIYIAGLLVAEESDFLCFVQHHKRDKDH
jgi:hypothetical protein